MKKCKTCETEKEISKFPSRIKDDGTLYVRPHCHSCVYNKAEGYRNRTRDKMKEYHKNYHRRHPEVARHKGAIHDDKVKDRYTDLTLDKYREMVNNPCYYCERIESIGLDRKDSNLGHTIDNCLPCCEKCNMILGDLPMAAKECLKDGLIEIRKQELLIKWEIPTKRRKVNERN